jgi:hypothetical protein
VGCLKIHFQTNTEEDTMTENIEPQNNNTPLWKRAFGFIQAMEEASEYSPAERAVIDLNKRVSELEGTIRNLENKTH